MDESLEDSFDIPHPAEHLGLRPSKIESLILVRCFPECQCRLKEAVHMRLHALKAVVAPRHMKTYVSII